MAARTKRQVELAQMAGWASERFSRETILKPFHTYIEPETEPDDDAAQEAAAREWAAGLGLKFTKETTDG